MNENVKIGNVLKKLRKEKNITQGQLAKLIGVSPSTIGMYEQGNRRPTYDILFKISEVFGTTTDYLLRGENVYADKDIEDSDVEDIDLKLKEWAARGMLTAFENYSAWTYSQKKELVELLERVNKNR